MGSNIHMPSVVLKQQTERSIAEPHSVADNRVENRLHVRGRAADDLQDFAGRRLLLEGFGERFVAFLQFLEQPHVLDRDNGLVGKGLEHGNLPFGKLRGLCTRYADGTDWAVVAEDWN